MNKIDIFIAVAALLLLVACTGPAADPGQTTEPTQTQPTDTPPFTPTSEPTPIAPTETTLPTPTPVPPSATPVPTSTPVATTVAEVAYPGLPLPKEKGELFSASGACTLCHRKLVDESGADVSVDMFWRSTMMANAARDPYWQASVREEVLSFPDYQAVIEDACTTCHMPMARFTAMVNDEPGQMFDEGFTNSKNKLHALAMDGVSCTVCHQIEATGLGDDSSLSGGFVIGTDLPKGERLIYGPYPVDDELGQKMQNKSDFIPVQSQHIKRSELCATCHTLYTPTIDATGQIVGRFPEQMPYFEWLHSDYQETFTCQGCHMPEAQGAVAISNAGGDPRSPFSKHVFVGGNVYMLTILRTFGEELGVTASSDHFAATIDRTKDQLQNRTATVAFDEAKLSRTQLTASVVVESQVGHKFPTGFPARRVWLHLTVHDASGEIVFESGGFRTDGSIVGNDNDADPATYEPHHQTVSRPDQAQIYEAILHDSEGKVTTTLLRGAGYLKDNRLLPSGFDKSTAEDNIAPYGLALEDPDFIGSGDRVRYTVDVGNHKGPFTVTVELLYQSISYRWIQNLGRYQAPEITRFLGYAETLPNLPVTVATATVKVE